MKIAIVSTYFPPIAGGEGINAYNLAKELAKKHKVHVFTSDKRNGLILNREEIIHRINIHRLKARFRLGFHFVFYPSLIRKLLDGNFDIIHFHSFGILQHDLAVLKLRKNKPNVILINTPHHESFALDYSLAKKIIIFLVKNFEKKKVIPKYDTIISVNPNQYKWMKKWGVKKKKIKFLPNGLDKENFKTEKDINIVNKYRLNDKFIISYIGRIQDYKGLDQVIKVLPGLLKVNRNIVFICIGKDFGNKKRLINLANKLNVKKNIFFTREVNEKEKLVLLKLTDIFILPSKIEGFGIVLLEAMAQKVPIVSTKTEGGEFLIQNGVNGYTYNFNDLKRLEKILIKLIKNKRLRKKLGNNGYKISKKFLWEDISKKLENIYLEAINEKNKSSSN